MNLVFVVQERNINVAVGLYSKTISNVVKNITIPATRDKIFLYFIIN